MDVSLNMASPPVADGAPLMRIAKVQDEARDARTIVIDVPGELAELYRGVAGQFVAVRFPGDERTLERCYSLSNSPEIGERLQITVKGVPGGQVSNRLVGDLRSGDRLHVAPPAGRFTLADEDRPLVLIAGGSGVTPVFSLLKAALHATRRRIGLLYSVRNRDQLIFGREIEALKARFPERLDRIVHFSDDDGNLTRNCLLSFVALFPGCRAYVCGPDPMMNFVEEALGPLEVSGAIDLMFERFGAPAAEPVVVEAAGVTSRISVALEGSAHVFDCAPGQSILEAGLQAGVRLPHSCKEGHCGACMARVVDGCVEQFAAAALSKRDRSRGRALACCAFPMTETVELSFD